MIATVVNALTIIIGSFVGLSFRRFIKENTFVTVLKGIGIVVMVFGFIGIIKSMIYVAPDLSFKSSYELLLIISISIGTLIGSLLRINDRLEQFSKWIEEKYLSDKGNFSIGFIDATLVFCVGAMAIVGSINASLGDPNTIYLKSIIDGVTAIILASTLGYGVLFSSVTVFLYQGFITLLGYVLGDFMSVDFVNAFSAVGYVMVTALGINFLTTSKIKVADMLPSLIIVIIYFGFFR